MSDSKLDLILDKIQSMGSQNQSIENKMKSMENKMQSMESTVQTMNIRMEENIQITKAILHRQEEADAKIEGLSLDLAKLHGEVTSVKSSVSKLTEDQKSIHELLGEHEISIRSIRRKTI